MVLKKSLKILLSLAAINLIVSWAISIIFGNTRFLSFIQTGGGYEIKGMLTSTFFFGVMIAIYLTLFVLLPPMVVFLRKSFGMTRKFTSMTGALFFGQTSKEDIKEDFAKYMKKIISSIVILAGILIIPLNFIIISETQNKFIIAGFFILVVVSLFFLRKIYNILA